MKRPLLKDVRRIIDTNVENAIYRCWLGWLDKRVILVLRKNQEEITNIEKALENNGLKMTFDQESLKLGMYTFYITKKEQK